MWEESLIFMFIYLGVFFILPDKIRNKLIWSYRVCLRPVCYSEVS